MNSSSELILNETSKPLTPPATWKEYTNWQNNMKAIKSELEADIQNLLAMIKNKTRSPGAILMYFSMIFMPEFQSQQQTKMAGYAIAMKDMGGLQGAISKLEQAFNTAIGLGENNKFVFVWDPKTDTWSKSTPNAEAWNTAAVNFLSAQAEITNYINNDPLLQSNPTLKNEISDIFKGSLGSMGAAGFFTTIQDITGNPYPAGKVSKTTGLPIEPPAKSMPPNPGYGQPYTNAFTSLTSNVSSFNSFQKTELQYEQTGMNQYLAADQNILKSEISVANQANQSMAKA